MTKRLFRGFHVVSTAEPRPVDIEKIFVNDKWVEGMWICGDGIHYPKSPNYTGTCWIDGMHESANDWIFVIPRTVSEFTGQRDIKGQRIFEDDLCEDTNGDLIQIVWREHHYSWGCKIVKTDCALSCGLAFPLWQWNNLKENGYRQLKIVGNIFNKMGEKDDVEK